MRGFLTNQKEASFGAKRAKRSSGYIRTRRRARAAAVLGSVLAALVAQPQAQASHAPPAITDPLPGAFVSTGIVEVRGTSPGDAVTVRVFEGVTELAAVGPLAGYWSANIGLADGSHTIKAKACDAAAVCSAFSPTVTFTVDTVAPAAPVFTTPPNGAILGFASVTVQGTAEPDAVIDIDISSGGTATATASGAGAWTLTRTFTDTTHTLVARATDRAGNTSLDSAPRTFTVDTIAPLAPVIFAPATGQTLGSAALTVRGEAEPGSTLTVYEGAPIGSTTVSNAGTWSIAAVFGEGPHSITARALDAAGNISAASPPVSFTIDLTAPPAPVITAPVQNAVVGAQVSIEGTAEPNAEVLLIINSVQGGTTRADGNGLWRIAKSMFGGTHTVRARARDAGGNLGPLSAARTFNVDSEPPRVDVTTPRHTIFLPSQDVLIEGTASDDMGVAVVELEFYDLLGRNVAIRNANRCFPCPTGTQVDWSSDYSPGIGRFVVKAFAVDRAGNRSLVDETIVIRV